MLFSQLVKTSVTVRLMRHLSNWREVWRPYFSGEPVPTLRFRCGLEVHHGELDGPIPTILEIFGNRCYGKNIDPPKKGTIVDLGANIGLFSLYWANRAEEVLIHAYEPSPQTLETLNLNIAANNLSERVTVFGEGVGQNCGETEMWSGLPSLIATGCENPAPTPTAVPVRIQTINLDEVVNRAGPIDLLKIDTEGAEADILEGASSDTLKQIKQIVLEYHDHLCPSALERCQRVLQRANYTCLVEPDRRSSDRFGLLYATRN